MNLKNRAWKFATALLVFLIILNPELFQLALFIDAIGLELFLMLLEVQVVALFGTLFSYRLQPVLTFFRYLKAESGYLVIAVTPQTLIMQGVVCSVTLAAALTALT